MKNSNMKTVDGYIQWDQDGVWDCRNKYSCPTKITITKDRLTLPIANGAEIVELNFAEGLAVGARVSGECRHRDGHTHGPWRGPMRGKVVAPNVIKGAWSGNGKGHFILFIQEGK